MSSSVDSPRRSAWLMSPLLIGVLLISCANSAPTSGGGDRSETTAVSAPQSSENSTNSVTEVPRSRPQLIKKAELTLVVDRIDKTLQSVTTILETQQGDLLSLQDQSSPDAGDRRLATLQLRVPQDKLDPTLEALAKQGTVQRRSITAEDVSNQLVDYQARLRNLRRSEDSILKILERAGSISEVLQVSQELSEIRASIEQLDAQLTSLKNQVAYSTITLTLEQAIATTTPDRALGTQVQEAWSGATQSVGKLTVNLLKLGIWLLAYSPYLVILSVAATLGYRRWHQSKVHRLPQAPESSTAK